MNAILLTLWILLGHTIGRIRGNEQVEIDTPDNSVFYRKVGNLYPSVNVGHIRLQINLTKVRGITTTICSHSNDLSPYLEYTNTSLLTQMSTSIQSAFNSLSEDQKLEVPTPMFTMTYRAQLAMLNRFCVQSLEST